MPDVQVILQNSLTPAQPLVASTVIQLAAMLLYNNGETSKTPSYTLYKITVLKMRKGGRKKS